MADSDPDDPELDEFDEITETLADLERQPPRTHSLKHTLLAIERREYIAALKRANGWSGEARRQLGVMRTIFYQKMTLFGLKAADYRCPES